VRVVTADDVARVDDHSIEALFNPSADFLFGQVLCLHVTDCRQAAGLLRRFGNCRMAQTVGVPGRSMNQFADLPMQASADDVMRANDIDLLLNGASLRPQRSHGGGVEHSLRVLWNRGGKDSGIADVALYQFDRKLPQILNVGSRLAQRANPPVLPRELLDEVQAKKSVGAGNETTTLGHDVPRNGCNRSCLSITA
jgi:hypothetical protein